MYLATNGARGGPSYFDAAGTKAAEKLVWSLPILLIQQHSDSKSPPTVFDIILACTSKTDSVCVSLTFRVLTVLLAVTSQQLVRLLMLFLTLLLLIINSSGSIIQESRCNVEFSLTSLTEREIEVECHGGRVIERGGGRESESHMWTWLPSLSLYNHFVSVFVRPSSWLPNQSEAFNYLGFFCERDGGRRRVRTDKGLRLSTASRSLSPSTQEIFSWSSLRLNWFSVSLSLSVGKWFQ